MDETKADAGDASAGMNPAGSSLEFWITYAEDLILGPPRFNISTDEVVGIHPDIMRQWKDWLAQSGAQPTLNQLKVLLAQYSAQTLEEGEYLETLDQRFSTGLEAAEGREPDTEISAPTVDRLVQRGLLNPSRGTRRPIFSLEELQRFLRETTTNI